MVVIASPTKPFSYTGKGTVRRQAALQLYEEEIEVAYTLVQESTRQDVPLPKSWDVLNATAYVRSLVGKLLQRRIRDDADLFEHGIDR